MRTFLISYDLANPVQNKHAIAQSIMSAGERWARPLESTWYLTSDKDEASLADRIGPLLDTDDGLLIQSVDDQAVLTNTSLRWFRQRRVSMAKADAIDVGESNVVAFPAPAPTVEDEPELRRNMVRALRKDPSLQVVDAGAVEAARESANAAAMSRGFMSGIVAAPPPGASAVQGVALRSS